MQKNNRKVAVYIHEGMEILDFAGPVEVFTHAGFDVFTVSHQPGPILSQGVVTITPQFTFKDCPQPDILVFLGGNSAEASRNETTLSWLKTIAPDCELIYSVCTGAFFLAQAGLLNGKKATTFHSAIPDLRKVAPDTEVIEGVKYVDNGQIITAAGVSSGIDGALYIVERLLGTASAERTARYMEYDFWRPAGVDAADQK